MSLPSVTSRGSFSIRQKILLAFLAMAAMSAVFGWSAVRAITQSGALVVEAYEVGQRARLDPTLILAVMAIESSFNPFAQSSVGAQGLMQVMTQIHSDKYEHFGGQYAAFDPKTNLRVGVKVLQEYIGRTGSVEAGLKWYVGAANLASDGGYADKVLAEHARLYQVAKGKPRPDLPGLRALKPAPATNPSDDGTLVKVATLS